MAQSTTERVTTLERRTDVQASRLDTLVEDINTVSDAHAETMKKPATVERDSDREVALLKREVEELKKWQDELKRQKEEWGRKLWMIVPPVLAALLSSVVTLIVALSLRR